jgi:hypothetical protein
MSSIFSFVIACIDRIRLLQQTICNDIWILKRVLSGKYCFIGKSVFTLDFWSFIFHSVIPKLCVATLVSTVKIFLFQTVKIFLFKTVKIFLSKLSKFPFPNCQNFSFQTVKIFLSKLSKFSFTNCQNFLFLNCQNFSF